MSGSDHSAQCYQQDGARYDEGQSDKGFRKGDDEGNGKDPIRMGLGRYRDPIACFMGKPMQKLKHASLSLLFSDRFPGCLPGWDISDIFIPCRAAISAAAR